MESVAFDQTCVWHPFTQIKTAAAPLPIIKAEGAYLIDRDGNRYFDAVSSWWVTTHGHCHPYIAERIARQCRELDQVLFADFTHAGAVELAERLVSLLGMEKGKVFFSENGSTAVESALKIALQYWHNAHERGASKLRTKILSFQNAYHGDTFGAMSASGKTPFNRPFWPYLFEVEAISPPYAGQEERSLKQCRQFLEKGDVAAFIFEPIVQGVSGMHAHSAEGLNALIALCHQHQVIAIADEVMTGFGRTGPLFACDRLSYKPDITCVSKGLTGGFLPLGAAICRESIFQVFADERTDRAFLHGHSYCGNPLTCASALASLDLFAEPSSDDLRQNIEQHHRQFQQLWGSHPSLKRCDVIGTILALEYRSTTNGYFSQLQKHLKRDFLSHRIFIRPLGNVLYLMPPYCTSSEALEQTYTCIQTTLETSSWKSF